MGSRSEILNQLNQVHVTFVKCPTQMERPGYYGWLYVLEDKWMNK